MARETGLSKSSVQRLWSAYQLQPHRVRNFKLLLFAELDAHNSFQSSEEAGEQTGKSQGSTSWMAGPEPREGAERNTEKQDHGPGHQSCFRTLQVGFVLFPRPTYPFL
jgi:hypothetical protein